MTELVDDARRILNGVKSSDIAHLALPDDRRAAALPGFVNTILLRLSHGRELIRFGPQSMGVSLRTWT